MDKITLKELLSQIELDKGEKVVLAYKKDDYENTISPNILNAKLSDIKDYLNKEVEKIRIGKTSDFYHYLVIVVKN